jgi:flagellar M-ring protein FliF
MATAIAANPGELGSIPAGNDKKVTGQAVQATTNPEVDAARAQMADVTKFPTVSEVFAQPLVRKSLPGLMLLFVLLGFLVLYLWINEGEYRTLFPEMMESDRSEAYDLLTSSDVRVRISVQTGNLEVPMDQYHEARMLLAASGLPRSTNTNTQVFENFDMESAMTTSQFMEEARYVAAIENELAKSITRISSIESARVHIAAPRQSSFVRNRTPTKASVVVTPFRGRSITQAQVQSISYLVSSSVPYLAVSDVSVVDNMGNLLTNSLTPSLTEATLQSGYERSVEEDYKERIIQLLEPLIGRENLRTDVDVTLDFTQLETTSERYDDDGNGPVTRSEILVNDESISRAAGGVPGATTNVVPNDTVVTAQAGGDQPAQPIETGPTSTSNRTTRNYEVDKTMRYQRNQVGQLVKMSVAVVLNQTALAAGDASNPDDISEDVLNKFRTLIEGAIGFNEERGDVVNVITTPFRPYEIIANPVKWYEDTSIIALIKMGAITLAFILLTVLVIRPVIRLYLPKVEIEDGIPKRLADGELSEEDLAMINVGDGETLEEIKAKLKPKKSTISADMLDTANTYDDKVALIRLLVAEDSGRVANVMKKMIKTN